VGLVGLVLPELENPIFPAFSSAVGAALSQRGYPPVLCTQSFGGVHEDDYVRMLLDRQVAGIVFISGLHANLDADPARYRALLERALPIVLVNGDLPGVDAPSVSSDDAGSVDLAVGHLAQLGHRRIGLAIGPRRYLPVIRKLAAFPEALARHLGALQAGDGRSPVECTHFTVEGGMAATGALLERGCTGIVCGSDLMALGAVRAARERGLRVPEDVSVVGSDDSLLIGYTDPPLTTVRQPVAAMSAAAVDALLDVISGVSSSPRAEYVFRPELVVRGSTAPVRRGRRGPVSLAAQAGS